MTTIKLLDARRGLNLKCRELFRDEKVAETIYRYLCDGIEECEDAETGRKTGRWEYVDYGGFGNWHCTACRQICICNGDYDFCPNCGADMKGGNDETD